MGKTHYSGPVYGVLGSVVIALGDCATNAKTTGYGLIPDGYIFHLEKCVANYVTGTNPENGVLNIGNGTDVDKFVAAETMPSAGTGGEISLDGAGPMYETGSSYIKVELSYTTSDSAQDVVVTVFGYLEEEDPDGL